jgi:hypothetical protein
MFSVIASCGMRIYVHGLPPFADVLKGYSATAGLYEGRCSQLKPQHRLQRVDGPHAGRCPTAVRLVHDTLDYEGRAFTFEGDRGFARSSCPTLTNHAHHQRFLFLKGRSNFSGIVACLQRKIKLPDRNAHASLHRIEHSIVCETCCCNLPSISRTPEIDSSERRLWSTICASII